MNRKQRRSLASGKNRPAAEFEANAALDQAMASHRSGQLGEAAGLYRKILVCRPDMADCLHLLGLVAYQNGRYGEALKPIGRAIAINPNFAAYHSNLGIALKDLGRSRDAAQCYRAALRLDPNFPAAFNNLGYALEDLGDLDQSVAACIRAILLRPDLADAFNNLGNSLRAQGRFAAAGAAFGRAVKSRPDFVDAYSNLVLSQHYDPAKTAADILQVARQYALCATPKSPQPRRAMSAGPARRLRIGYVSGDLLQHPVGYFLRPVLAAHDRAAFEITCYCNNVVQDNMTAHLKQHADRWRSLVGVSDEAAAAMIGADQIDILVDLSGHTARNRLPLFARRAAPVQATWLGFWGTTGLSQMDFILSDAVTIPPGEEVYYAEQVLRFADSRLCYGPPKGAPEPTRTGRFTFGSFNNLTKVGPDVVELWARLLTAVPGARLLLKWKTLGEEVTRRKLLDAFAQAGVSPDRIELRGSSPHVEMLSQYADIDIALDPFPFSGGLTSCEALWMGVPVVTMRGANAPSRQTAGFLQALGRAEWIAVDKQGYIDLAARLAADPAALAHWRGALRQTMANSPLCDGERFTRKLEAAFREMCAQAIGTC